MYTYCNNNSIIYTDYTGKGIGLSILILLALGLVSATLLTSCTSTPSEEDGSNQDLNFPQEPLYATYEDALQEAYSIIFYYGQNGSYTIPAGREWAINIYFNIDEDDGNGMYQLSTPYSDGQEDWVNVYDVKKTKGTNLYWIGTVHYHPGATAKFSPEDMNTAAKHEIAMHVIACNKETDVYNKFQNDLPFPYNMYNIVPY